MNLAYTSAALKESWSTIVLNLLVMVYDVYIHFYAFVGEALRQMCMVAIMCVCVCDSVVPFSLQLLQSISAETCNTYIIP